MPTYSYSCNKCNKDFELFLSIKDYTEQPRCVSCNSIKTYRRYMDDVATLNTSVKKADSELKTLGDIANRNRDRMSDDQKQALNEKHSAYRDNEILQDLPKGMSRMKKQNKTK